MKRKRWTEDEKVAIVLEAIRGETPVEEIARREGVSATQIFKWREAFVEGGRERLKDRRTKNGRDPVAYENRRLKEMVGQQTLIIETQKTRGDTDAATAAGDRTRGRGLEGLCGVPGGGLSPLVVVLPTAAAASSDRTQAA